MKPYSWISTQVWLDPLIRYAALGSVRLPGWTSRRDAQPERNNAAGPWTEDHAAQTQPETVVEPAAAQPRRTSGLTEAAPHRIDAVRQELGAARRRNADLIREVDALRNHIDDMRRSTSWRVTLPLRLFARKTPPWLRGAPRWGANSFWWRLTFGRFRTGRTTDQRLPTGIPAAPAAPWVPPDSTSADRADQLNPSDEQRRRDQSWVEPNERAAFIALRGHRRRAKIAVVVHVYYPLVWPELQLAIGNIAEDFDLFVTLVTGASDRLAPDIAAAFPGAHVLTVDNHGRDIFPFLALIRTGALFEYEVVCKLHTKRSPHDEDGDAWRQNLIRGILGSPELVRQILAGFRRDPDLGLVAAADQIFSGRLYWGANEVRCRQLFRDIGLSESAFERPFAGGSMFWIRPFILRVIDGMRLGYDDFEQEPISNDGHTPHAVERLFSSICHDAGMRVADPAQLARPLPPTRVPPTPGPRVQVIAHYLPQFHPIPENDAWWGKGFTEWRNVTAATSLFRGHRQPRLPADLGFYDLRVAETRAAQADLARRHGVTAFSYYYYWFNGRRLLNRPLDEVVASGQPDFPFMLCWANEPWTRSWDGLTQGVLLAQDYQTGWETKFAADTAPILRDRRYLRLNGRPVLALYRVAHIQGGVAAIRRLRAAFAAQGIAELHLIGGWLQIGADRSLPADPTALGLDAYFEFPPHGLPLQSLEIPFQDRAAGCRANVWDYAATVDAMLDQVATQRAGFRYRGVMMGWDNTARRGNLASVFHGATPANFRRWLHATLQIARSEARGPETAVFINAWNEWAEGTYLEPDRDFGSGWLEAVASATAEYRND